MIIDLDGEYTCMCNCITKIPAGVSGIAVKVIVEGKYTHFQYYFAMCESSKSLYKTQHSKHVFQQIPLLFIQKLLLKTKGPCSGLQLTIRLIDVISVDNVHFH